MDTMGYLRKIGQFGKNPDGSYTRHIFSPEWERAADLVRSEMKALSMKTDRDAAGNEHGVLLGSVPGLPAIILGSHLDTVPSGGLYDGAMGVAAALAALSRAQKEGAIFRHPMEIYAFNGEEFNPLGALFGSRVLTGWFDSEAPHMKDALHSFGKTGEEMAAARRDFAGVKAISRPISSRGLSLLPESFLWVLLRALPASFGIASSATAWLITVVRR